MFIWVLDIKSEAGKLLGTCNISHTVVSLGRTGCDIELDDEKVSKLHASFLLHEQNLILVDNNSTNGTYVNGHKVDKKELKDGDLIIVGNTNISVKKVRENCTLN